MNDLKIGTLRVFAAISLTALLGCSEGVTIGGDLCAEAAARVKSCFGTEMGECDASVAGDILSQTCEEIVASAQPAAKADGGFCPAFLWFICGDTIESRWQCATAENASAYDSWDGARRLAWHWDWMQCTEYGVSGNPEYITSGWKLLLNTANGAATSLLKLGRSFTNSTDELDVGRVKMLHPYGTVAQIELTLNRETDPRCHTDYSGLWTEDTLFGIARLGWGAPPKAGYVPGMAIKFFIDRGDSVNLHLIHTLDASEDPNFFAVSLTHVLPEPQNPAIRAVSRYFALFVDNPLHLSVKHTGRWYSDGREVPAAEQSVPFKLTFEPAPAMKDMWDSELVADERVDFREVFARVDTGTVLYELYARAEEDGCSEHIGTLSTVSRFIASAWSDERLHFSHATEGQGL